MYNQVKTWSEYLMGALVLSLYTGHDQPSFALHSCFISTSKDQMLGAPFPLVKIGCIF
jgi:hypothetical protein